MEQDLLTRLRQAAASTDSTPVRGLLEEALQEIARLHSAILGAAASVTARPMDRTAWVRLMCFWGDGQVWNSDDEQAEDAPAPLSGPLRAAIVAWKHSLDCCATVKPSDLVDFSTQALNLARRIKDEQPDWRVLYVDRSKSGADIRNKDYFELEM